MTECSRIARTGLSPYVVSHSSEFRYTIAVPPFLFLEGKIFASRNAHFIILDQNPFLKLNYQKDCSSR